MTQVYLNAATARLKPCPCLVVLLEMLGRFEKGDIVELVEMVRVAFKVSRRRKGVVRFAYDHDPPAYDVEFFREGRSLGVHYLADDGLRPFIVSSK